jgi:hypothetical protein
MPFKESFEANMRFYRYTTQELIEIDDIVWSRRYKTEETPGKIREDVYNYISDRIRREKMDFVNGSRPSVADIRKQFPGKAPPSDYQT